MLEAAIREPRYDGVVKLMPGGSREEVMIAECAVTGRFAHHRSKIRTVHRDGIGQKDHKGHAGGIAWLWHCPSINTGLDRRVDECLVDFVRNIADKSGSDEYSSTTGTTTSTVLGENVHVLAG